MNNQRSHIIVSILFLVLLTSHNSFISGRKQPLFNGKDLSGWDTYIGPVYDSVQQKFIGSPVGVDRDPDHVFSVVKEDGEPAMRISGEKFGGISTEQSFKNYHFQLEFKWGKQKWHPKKNAKRDSGLLYHAVGEHGADGGFWMRSQEFQIQEGDCGDYWGVAGGMADVPAIQRGDKKFVYSPGSPLVVFSEKGLNGRNCIKNPDAEKPSGEWNIIDVYCYGDTSVHVVNGTVTMVLYNLRQSDGEKEKPLTGGKIQLQSEGAELFYRKLWLENIKEIPKEVLN